MPQTIAILDFGAQYVQLIARRVRENLVHSLIFPPNVSPDELRRNNVIGVILSGGPASAYEGTAPQPHANLLDLDVPMLGICYGMQALCRRLGASVSAAASREYGRTTLTMRDADPLLDHVPKTTNVWMSHGDVVTTRGEEFAVLSQHRQLSKRHRAAPLAPDLGRAVPPLK